MPGIAEPALALAPRDTALHIMTTLLEMLQQQLFGSNSDPISDILFKLLHLVGTCRRHFYNSSACIESHEYANEADKNINENIPKPAQRVSTLVPRQKGVKVL